MLFSVLAEFVPPSISLADPGFRVNFLSSPPAWSWVLLPLDFHFAKGSLLFVQWQVLAPRTDFVPFWLAHWSAPFSSLPIRWRWTEFMNRFSLCHQSLVKFRLDFSFQRSAYSLDQSSPPVCFLRRSALLHQLRWSPGPASQYAPELISKFFLSAAKSFFLLVPGIFFPPCSLCPVKPMQLLPFFNLESWLESSYSSTRICLVVISVVAVCTSNHGVVRFLLTAGFFLSLLCFGLRCYVKALTRFCLGVWTDGTAVPGYWSGSLRLCFPL
jgi:hypothetical protein